MQSAFYTAAEIRERLSISTLVLLRYKPTTFVPAQCRHVRDASDQNPMTRPGGPTNVVGICGHRLRHIHLHGFVDTDHYPPFHTGDRIQWVELFGMLKSVDYPGLINFEPSTSRARDGAIEAAGTFPDRIIEMAHTSDAQTSGGSRHSDWGSVERGSG